MQHQATSTVCDMRIYDVQQLHCQQNRDQNDNQQIEEQKIIRDR